MQPKFSTLIILTLLTAVILFPFAVSKLYMPVMRDQAFAVYELVRGDLYKQITGFIGLTLVLAEIGLTLRKRGRSLKIKFPGSMLLWRVIHIFVGVGLIGTVLVHTVGATGRNFNAVFLWVFFAVTLSALVGVVAETGILESSIKYFRFVPDLGRLTKSLPAISKGPLIRGLRAFWLSTHIFLVSVFVVMLGFHIFLAYYFQ